MAAPPTPGRWSIAGVVTAVVRAISFADAREAGEVASATEAQRVAKRDALMDDLRRSYPSTWPQTQTDEKVTSLHAPKPEPELIPEPAEAVVRAAVEAAEVTEKEPEEHDAVDLWASPAPSDDEEEISRGQGDISM